MSTIDMRRDFAPAAPAEDASARPTVAVVITAYNHAHFLAAALRSVERQTRPADEVIVVDDGSHDDPAAAAAPFAGVRVIRQENGGLSAARNTGLHAATSEFILFLDADDRLRSNAVEAGLECFAENPDAGFVYGGYYLTDHRHRRTSRDVNNPVGDDPFRTFLESNAIGMHATVLYRRELLIEVGGYDPELRRCEDYDVYLRMAQDYPVASHPHTVAEYHWHGNNMSRAHREMLDWVLRVHARQHEAAQASPTYRRAWRKGRQGFIDYYGGEVLRLSLNGWALGGRNAPRLGEVVQDLRDFPRTALIMAPRIVWRGWRKLVIGKAVRLLPPRARKTLKSVKWRIQNMFPKPISFGDLGSTKPISDEFGYDRGTPVDRQYIGEFLLRHTADVKGRALEIGDDEYSQKFGAGKVTQQDILHVHAGNPTATIVGDLSQPGVLPDDAFDVMVLTQTLHLIWDVQAAVREMRRALKPGGVLLLTVPGITRVDRDEWGATWYWSFTEQSATKLFNEAFGEENVKVEVFGNVYAATAFIQGLALEEVDYLKLQPVDPSFPVILGVRAVKAAA